MGALCPRIVQTEPDKKKKKKNNKGELLLQLGQITSYLGYAAR